MVRREASAKYKQHKYGHREVHDDHDLHITAREARTWLARQRSSFEQHDSTERAGRRHARHGTARSRLVQMMSMRSLRHLAQRLTSGMSPRPPLARPSRSASAWWRQCQHVSRTLTKRLARVECGVGRSVSSVNPRWRDSKVGAVVLSDT
jgi:hypothetical protein